MHNVPGTCRRPAGKDLSAASVDAKTFVSTKNLLSRRKGPAALCCRVFSGGGGRVREILLHGQWWERRASPEGRRFPARRGASEQERIPPAQNRRFPGRTAEVWGAARKSASGPSGKRAVAAGRALSRRGSGRYPARRASRLFFFRSGREGRGRGAGRERAGCGGLFRKSSFKEGAGGRTGKGERPGPHVRFPPKRSAGKNSFFPRPGRTAQT